MAYASLPRKQDTISGTRLAKLRYNFQSAANLQRSQGEHYLVTLEKRKKQIPSPDKYGSTGQLLPAISKSTKKSLIYMHERKNFFDDQARRDKHLKKGPGDYDTYGFDEAKNRNKKFFVPNAERYTFSDQMLDESKKASNKHYDTDGSYVSYSSF